MLVSLNHLSWSEIRVWVRIIEIKEYNGVFVFVTDTDERHEGRQELARPLLHYTRSWGKQDIYSQAMYRPPRKATRRVAEFQVPLEEEQEHHGKYARWRVPRATLDPQVHQPANNTCRVSAAQPRPHSSFLTEHFTGFSFPLHWSACACFYPLQLDLNK